MNCSFESVNWLIWFTAFTNPESIFESSSHQNFMFHAKMGELLLYQLWSPTLCKAPGQFQKICLTEIYVRNTEKDP